jgi:hypothetical protein
LQATFNVTVRPKVNGQYESTRARVRYNPSPIIMEDVEPDYKSGYSSSLGRIRIISPAEHLRNTSYQWKEWSLFAVSFAALTLLPMYYWLSSKFANDSLSVKRKTA